MISRKYLMLYRVMNTRRHCIDSIIKLNRPPQEQELHVKGWVKSVRSHKERTFIAVNDGSCLESLQVVVQSDSLQHPVAATYGACVEVTGELQHSPGAHQQFDLIAKSINVLGSCDQKEYPFKKKKIHSPEYTRQFPHLRPRTKTFSSLLRVRNSLSHALHTQLQDAGYMQVHTPILTSNDCEGAGEVFRVLPANASVSDTDSKNGGRKEAMPIYLTVSGQLHLEAVAGAFTKVYTFGPTFRAENSRGRHHLSEFYMLEAEVAFVNHLEDLMKVVENLIQKSTKHIMKCHEADIVHLWKSSSSLSSAEKEEIVENLMSKSYERISYSKALEIIQKSCVNFQHDIQWGDDLQKEHEKYLVKHCGNIPVFITEYPAQIKPFYMQVNADSQTVAAMDLLLPEVGEVCGGSIRESRLDVLEQRLEKLDMRQSLAWYLDLRKFGSCPHGGFGLGFERLLQAILGIDNIRDAIPFPRTLNSCKL